MDIDWLRVRDELAIEWGRGVNIKKSRAPRKGLLEEMVSWPRGDLVNYSEDVPSKKSGRLDQIYTEIYESDGLQVGVLAPGKEASNDSDTKSYVHSREKKPNHNDVLPVVKNNGKREREVDLTFEQMFEQLVKGAGNSPDGLLIFSAMMFRNGYCWDHHEQTDNVYRLIIPSYSLSVLKELIPKLGDYPIKTQLYFLDVLATNEDAKVHALGFDKFEQYGRPNTLLTFSNICAFLLGVVSLGKLCGSFARFPRGMAPITQKDAKEGIFRILDEKAGY